MPEGKEGYSIASLSRRYPRAFRHLAIRNKFARDLDWEIVRPLIQVSHADDRHYVRPETDHGTHVAGILAADLAQAIARQRRRAGPGRHVSASHALRSAGLRHRRAAATNSPSCARIEFVGWLNRDRANPVVHGVNLSLALAHDVDSFACGQTPICEACNHLVGAGTVVVAAAGNTGFEGGRPEKQSIGTGYRAISITDPGNADNVITVGSTHRRDPHLYGVSYFSARGPTGDGRRKPDILAPGEKITSTMPGGRQPAHGRHLDGGTARGRAAALLMARYPELIGRPLSHQGDPDEHRDRSQARAELSGAGLVDVLRALQSV